MVNNTQIDALLDGNIPTEAELIKELNRQGETRIKEINPKILRKALEPRYEIRTLRAVAKRYRFFWIGWEDRCVYKYGGLKT